MQGSIVHTELYYSKGFHPNKGPYSKTRLYSKYKGIQPYSICWRNHKLCPGSRGEKIDPTSKWKEPQHHIVRWADGMGDIVAYRKIQSAIICLPATTIQILLHTKYTHALPPSLQVSSHWGINWKSRIDQDGNLVQVFLVPNPCWLIGVHSKIVRCTTFGQIVPSDRFLKMFSVMIN